MALAASLALVNCDRDSDYDWRDQYTKDREWEKERNWETFLDSLLGTTLHKMFSNLSMRVQPAFHSVCSKAKGAFVRPRFSVRLWYIGMRSINTKGVYISKL